MNRVSAHSHREMDGQVAGIPTLPLLRASINASWSTTPPRAVLTKTGSILHLSELFLAKAVLGVLVEREIEGDDIGPLQQLLEGRDIFAFKRWSRLDGLAVVVDDLHVECDAAIGDDLEGGEGKTMSTSSSLSPVSPNVGNPTPRPPHSPNPIPPMPTIPIVLPSGSLAGFNPLFHLPFLAFTSARQY